MSDKKPDPYKTDKDNPVWTAEDFRHARPAREDMPELVEAMKRARGQRGPQKAPLKERVTLRLDSEIVETFKKDGPGWQTRVNAALHEWIEERR